MPSIEKHTIFIDWKIPQSKNVSTSQVDLCWMQFLSNLVKIFVDTDKLIPKFMWKAQVTRIAKMMKKKKKNQVGEITLLDFETSFMVILWIVVLMGG